MDGITNTNVVCCFCGKSLAQINSIVLEVGLFGDKQETQCLFCHKNCFVQRVDRSIPLNADFLNADNDFDDINK